MTARVLTTARTALLTLAALGVFLPTAVSADAPATVRDARRIAFRGDLPAAIEGTKTTFTARPTAEMGRLLQDLLAVAGRSDERAGVATAETPELIRRGLEARLLPPKEAVAALTALVKTEGSAPVFRLDIALAQIRRGRASAAKMEVDRFLKDNEQSAEGHFVLGQVFVARKKDSAARSAFERVLQISPGHPGASVALATLLGKDEDRPAAARQLLTKSLRVYPNNPELRMGLVDDRVRAGALEEATGALQALLKLPAPKGPIHVRLAEVWRMRQDYAKAAASAATVLADKSISDDVRARALRVQAFTKQKKGDLAGARADYEAALRLLPESASLHADLGLVLTLANDTTGAEKVLEKALDLDKDLFEAHLHYGVLMFILDKPKKAKKSFSVVLKKDRDHVRANRYMGYVLIDGGKPKTAIKHFQKVADLRPEDGASMRMVGRCYMDMAKYDDAINAFDVAITRDPKDGFAHFDMGKAHEKKQDFEKAEAAYRKAIEVDAKITHPHLYLAELLHFEQGKPDDAVPFYQSYLKLGGDDPDGSIAKRVEQLAK